MRKTFVLMGILILCFIASVSYAKPYAAQLGADRAVFHPGLSSEPVTLSFNLSDAATTVTVEVFRASDSVVVRTFKLGSLEAGNHSVVWNGRDDSDTMVTAGDYKFKVTTSSDGYSSWTNITRFSYHIKSSYFRNTSFLDAHIATDSVLGIGLKGSKLIVTGGYPRQICATEAATGLKSFIFDMYVTNPYSLGFTSGTLDMNYGPFDVASGQDGTTLISPHVGSWAPVVKVQDETTSAVKFIGVTNALGYDSKALDIVNTGVNSILYVSNAANGNVGVFTTSDGITFSLQETIPCNLSNMVVGKDGNTLSNAVIWGSSEAGTIQRWVKSGGAWAQDTGFSCSIIGAGGDYVSIDGTDILVCASISDNKVYGIKGSTGAIAFTYTPQLAKLETGTNGDVTVKKLTDTTGEIYYIFPDRHIYGKLTYAYGELGSAQFKCPNGVAAIKNPDSRFFGNIGVSSGLNHASTNNGAETDLKGVFLLNNDLSYNGDNVVQSYSNAKNAPDASWNYTMEDSWSPWKLKAGRDDNSFYLGDWGDVVNTAKVFRYNLTNTATTLFSLSTSKSIWKSYSGKNHGRVVSCMTYTSGTTQMVGLDRDYDGDSYREVIKWPINSSVENYTGSYTVIAEAENTGLGVTDFNMGEDLIVDSNGNMYVVNGSSALSRNWLWCFNLIDGSTTVKWKKTGTDLGIAANTYPCAIDIDEASGNLYVLYRAGKFVGVHNASDGALTDQFTFTSTASASRGAIAVDAVGNVITANEADNHVRIWSPPGASSYTTTYIDKMTFPVSIDDWMLLK